MSGRIWIDVTDFLKWRGNFTGFQHIQYNMAKHYLTSGKDVKFFVYEQELRQFTPVEFDPDSVSANGVRTENSQKVVSKPTPARNLIHTAKRLTPKPVKQIVKRIVAGGDQSETPVITQITSSPFRRGDTVLVLGGIWHGTFAANMAREKKKRGFKFIHIVHDMIPIVVPQYVVDDLPGVFGAYKKIIFKIADGLVINSQSSKKDALAFMKENKITPPPNVVFRLADERSSNRAEEAVAGIEPGNFILMLGTLEGRKNPWLAYNAYKQALREGIKLPKLVIAGRPGWLVDDFLYTVTRDPDLKDQIVILKGVSNNERAWLYKNCMMFVWPSFYEGWGMPVAEALTYGKVCLSSDRPAMSEIGGKLIEYFSPYSADEFLRQITKFTNKNTRSKKESQIKKQYKTTSWADMYKTISKFVDSV